MGDEIATSLGLMRRMPPNKVEQNLTGLLNLLPENEDELLQRIDQPLREMTDSDTVSNKRRACLHFLLQYSIYLLYSIEGFACFQSFSTLGVYDCRPSMRNT